jgi:hypothetical protein
LAKAWKPVSAHSWLASVTAGASKEACSVPGKREVRSINTFVRACNSLIARSRGWKTYSI